MRRYRVYVRGIMLARYDDETCAVLLAKRMHGAVWDSMLRKEIYRYQ